MIFAIELGVAMILSIPITYIIIHLYKAKDRQLIFGDKLEDNQDDNPLLLTVKAMEAELAELHENNIHMKRIAQLEKDIEEANKHAEALSKVAGEYGSTMKEVGESMQRTVPKCRKMDDVPTRQYIASYRTYTKQAGWSSYHDVKFK